MEWMKMHFSQLTILAGILAAITVVMPSAPNLYIDPNTGGMLFQMLAVILALFSGIIFFFSRQIRSFFARVRRKIRGEGPPEEIKEEQTESHEE
jgi:hypothetical protein